MLGSAQRLVVGSGKGDIHHHHHHLHHHNNNNNHHHHQYQHYYQQLALHNNHFQPILFGQHKQEEFEKQLGACLAAAAASSSSSGVGLGGTSGAAAQEGSSFYVAGTGGGGGGSGVLEPTSVLDLWSPSPSSKGGCSGLSSSGGGTTTTGRGGGGNNNNFGKETRGDDQAAAAAAVANLSFRLAGGGGGASPPCSFDDNKSITSEKSSVEVKKFFRDDDEQQKNKRGFGGGDAWNTNNVEDSRRCRDKSLDEWLADLQQQKLLEQQQQQQDEEEEEEVELSNRGLLFSSSASSSSCNNNNSSKSLNKEFLIQPPCLISNPNPQQLLQPQEHQRQYGMEELESMLLSPCSSGLPAPPSQSLNQQQIAKWLLNEQQQDPQQQQQHFPCLVVPKAEEIHGPHQHHHDDFNPTPGAAATGFNKESGESGVFFPLVSTLAAAKPPPDFNSPAPSSSAAFAASRHPLQQPFSGPLQQLHPAKPPGLALPDTGFDQFLGSSASPGFGAAFQIDSAWRPPLQQNAHYGHLLQSRNLQAGEGGVFGGLGDSVGWSLESDRKRRAPPILQQQQQQFNLDLFAEDAKNRMMIQLMQQQPQSNFFGRDPPPSAFAVPLVADARAGTAPWPQQDLSLNPPRKLQRVHSNSTNNNNNRLMGPQQFDPIAAGYSPNSASAGSTSANASRIAAAAAPPTGGPATLPTTISVPDEGLGLMDQLLQLAQAIDIESTQVAQSILARLNQHLFCHQGKRIQRLAFYFKEALAARMNSIISSSGTSPGAEILNNFSDPSKRKKQDDQDSAAFPSEPSSASSSPVEIFNKVRAYTSFCEISPLLRFSYLSANQAIVDAIQGEASVHIVDFDPRFGSQWSSLMRDVVAASATATATATDGRASPSQPALRFTMVGPDPARLWFVVDSLRDFAKSLHMAQAPQFHVIVCDQPARLTPSMLQLADGEALVFNFMFSLHRSLALPDGVDGALAGVMTASPRLVTLAEQEVDDSDGMFQRRFVETLQYYAFVLDSLGPEDGAGILTVEREILSPDIANAVCHEGVRRTERHERLVQWKGRMSRAGFEPAAFSEVTRMQAECLIKRHTHGKNFEIVKDEAGLLLGWQGKPLVAVSAWTPGSAASSSAADGTKMNTTKNIC